MPAVGRGQGVAPPHEIMTTLKDDTIEHCKKCSSYDTNLWRDAVSVHRTKTKTDVVLIASIYCFVVGTIGLQQLNSTNEAGHIRDTVKVISKTVRQMVKAGEEISEAPSQCDRQTQPFESGENIIKYVHAISVVQSY